MRAIKKDTDVTIMALMTSSTDHISGVSGLDLTVAVSKNGGSFNEVIVGILSVGYGWYNISLAPSSTDTIGDLVLHIEAIGADPTDILMSVVEYTLDDIGLMASELHTIQGLNVSSPSTTTQTSWTAGDIEISITGNGETLTTMTRQ